MHLFMKNYFEVRTCLQKLSIIKRCYHKHAVIASCLRCRKGLSTIMIYPIYDEKMTGQ